MDSEDLLAALLYTLAVMHSFGAGGSIIEACGGSCDRTGIEGVEATIERGNASRLHAFIAMNFLTAIFCIPWVVLHLLSISFLKWVEVIFNLLTFLFAIAAAAIGISSKTNLVAFAPLLSWFSLWFVTGAIFLALKNSMIGRPPDEKHVTLTTAPVPLAGTTTYGAPVQPTTTTYAAPVQPTTTTHAAPVQPVQPAPQVVSQTAATVSTP